MTANLKKNQLAAGRMLMVLTSTWLTGCAGQQAPAEPRVSFAHPLHCYTAKQCAAMWASAETTLERESGMKIRMVTDTRMVTYTETDYGRMYGEVRKWRSPDESDTTITAEFSCGHHPGCRPDTAVRQFNDTVRAAGQGY
ncbi:putative lipoprotein [Paraburkholderia xenovorans LB400]|nr:putative lipoprotein [Paraburkholderia xenovorans LB400]